MTSTLLNIFSCFEAPIDNFRFKEILSKILYGLIQYNNEMILHMLSKSIPSFQTQVKDICPDDAFSHYYSTLEYPQRKKIIWLIYNEII